MYLYISYVLLCTYINFLMSPMSPHSLSVDSLLVATGPASQPTWLMVVANLCVVLVYACLLLFTFTLLCLIGHVL